MTPIEMFKRVPEGWSMVNYRNRRYGVTRTSHVGGRSMSIYAEELGGEDVVSANVYRTSTRELLKTCEMPEAKVLDFLRGWTSGSSASIEPDGEEPGLGWADGQGPE